MDASSVTYNARHPGMEEVGIGGRAEGEADDMIRKDAAQRLVKFCSRICAKQGGLVYIKFFLQSCSLKFHCYTVN